MGIVAINQEKKNIMPIPGFLIISLLVGASISFGARVQIRTLQRPIFYNRYFFALLMFQFFIILPAGVYFFAFYPDWSWMYMIDTTTIPTGVTIMALMTYPITGTMGYLLGYFSARGKSDWITVISMVFFSLTLGGLIFIGYEQIISLGTYTQFHRNIGLINVTTTSLLPATLIMWSCALFCWFYVLYRFTKEGRLAALRTA